MLPSASQLSRYAEQSSETVGLLDLFEQAWRTGQAPSISEFLAVAEAKGLARDAGTRRTVLAELVKVDLEYRWQAWRPEDFGRQDVGGLPAHPRVEDYAQVLSDIGPSGEVPIEVIAEEYRVRHRWGDRPRAEEYAKRFPHRTAEFVVLRQVDEELREQEGRGKGLLPPEGRPGMDRRSALSTPGQTGDFQEGGVGTPVTVVSVHLHAPGSTGGPTAPVLPGYRIDGVLGQGGMGLVYKAWHLQLKRPVALKMILAGGGARAQDLARFRTEAEAVAQLQHPNIVQIFDVGDYQGQPYLALEFVDGGSLAQKIHGVPQPPRQAAAVVAVLARAVHHAHQKAIVHRDLKPGNILVGGDGVFKVTDFGLAKRLDVERGQTQSGAILGTPSYMAPEQGGETGKTVGPPADVYALGAILYELLTGRPPFRAETPLDTLLQVLSEEPVAPSRLVPKLPRDLETICLKCLGKEPGKRYGSAALLAEDLERFQRDEPIVARPVPVWEKVYKWAKRRPAVTALLVVLAAVIGGSMAGLYALYARAERLRAAAEESYRDAREAVDYFSDVSENELANRPGMEELRKKLQDKSLTYYERFTEQRGKDPALRSDLAKAYVRRALITRTTGTKADSLELYRKALEIQEALVRDNPDDLNYQTELAKTHLQIGNIYVLTGKQPEGIELFLRAKDAFANVLAKGPAGDRLVRANLAHCYSNLGYAYDELGKLAESLEWSKKALAIDAELTAARPSADALKSLAVSWNNLGALQFRMEKYPEALRSFREATDIREKLLRKDAQDTNLRCDVASAYSSIGLVHEAQGQWADAFSHHERAIKIMDVLVRENPTVLGYQMLLAKEEVSVLLLEKQSIPVGDALRRFDQARKALEDLIKNDSQVPENQELLADAFVAIGDRLTGTSGKDTEGYFAQGRDLFKSLARKNPANPTYQCEFGWALHHLGRFYSTAKDAIKAEGAYREAVALQRKAFQDAPQVGRHRQELIETYTDFAPLLRNTGRAHEAAECSLERRKLAEDDGDELYKIAVELAVTVPSTNELAEQERLVREVIATLEQALHKGFKDKQQFRKAKEFGPLLAYPAFKEYLDRL